MHGCFSGGLLFPAESVFFDDNFWCWTKKLRLSDTMLKKMGHVIPQSPRNIRVTRIIERHPCTGEEKKRDVGIQSKNQPRGHVHWRQCLVPK